LDLARVAALLAVAAGGFLAGRVVGVAQLDAPTASSAAAPEPDDTREQLMALGYVSGTDPLPSQTGVTLSQRDKTQEGLNLVVSGSGPTAWLMEMDGEVLHRWQYDYNSAFPEHSRPVISPGLRYWRRVHLLEGGGLLAIFEGQGIIRIDRESNLVWASSEGAHHDLEVLPDGRILVLTRSLTTKPELSADQLVLEDFVTEMSQDGEVLARHSVLDAVLRSPWSVVMRMTWRKGDILHTNTLELLDDRVQSKVPAFSPGRVLLTIPHIESIAVMDLSTDEIVWLQVGPWRFPHQATVLDSGRLMVFDNRGHRGHSKVIELDPASGQIGWGYYGDEGNGFYTWACGSNQRLANGNTLITETDPGRVFEITPEGDRVWEYVNPEPSAEDDALIGRLFEVIRLPRSAAAWLPPGEP